MPNKRKQLPVFVEGANEETSIKLEITGVWIIIRSVHDTYIYVETIFLTIIRGCVRTCAMGAPRVPGTRTILISYRWHPQNFDLLLQVAPAPTETRYVSSGTRRLKFLTLHLIIHHEML